MLSTLIAPYQWFHAVVLYNFNYNVIFLSNMDILFLGGLFCDNQISFIKENSIGVVQNAADALQKKIIYGISRHPDCKIKVINLPFVGSYPRRFRCFFFPAQSCSLGGRAVIVGYKFCNLSIFKLLSRFIVSFQGLYKLCDKDSVVLIYSAHTPFILAALINKLIKKNKLCLVVPDLPEFMLSSDEKSIAYIIFKGIDSFIFYRFCKRIDFFVLLTSFMIHKMRIDPRCAVIVEGIADTEFVVTEYHRNDTRSILYTGTLSHRYGISNLIDAFSMMSSEKIELWICGDGDSKDYIISASKIDKRIKYFGQVPRNEAIALQCKTTVLINPRQPRGEYTKYSFPSKIMEYMASGRPLIMFHLCGIPDEYRPYYISPEGTDCVSLAKCIEEVINWSDEKLTEFGHNAMEFILREKNAIKQTNKIIELIMEKN